MSEQKPDASSEDNSDAFWESVPVIGTFVKSYKSADSFGKAVGGFQGMVLAIVLTIFKCSIGIVAWLGRAYYRSVSLCESYLAIPGGALLPIAIVALSTRQFSSLGMNYITALVAVAFWPLGWALGHIVTGELMIFISKFVTATLLIPAKVHMNVSFGENVQAVNYMAAGFALTAGISMSR